MSMYNMLFGVNVAAPMILATIGLTVDDIPRFRDCFLKDGQIIIHTRTGGGNRDWYDSEQSCRDNYPEEFTSDIVSAGPWNSDLVANQYYVRDEDDDCDPTYANFYFRYPEQYADDLKALETHQQAYTPSEKWQALLAQLESQQR